MKNIILIFVGWVFINADIFGQTVIKGNIFDTKGKSIPRINILIYSQQGGLVSYAVTDETGFFKTNVKSNSDTLLIEVSSIAYKKVIQKIPNKSQVLQFQLVPDIKQLNTIVIKAPAIEKHGDTISYLVNSFKKKQDKSIEDVLRRMPGIEVNPDGKILYQGIPIQKFYVEGLDLMDGRYSVVSKNLPVNSVSTVEVFENHQPIRILEGRVPSAQASLNIKLKRGVTITGTGKAGIGYKPFLWSTNITPMFFTKKTQALMSYQTNNTGNNIAGQTNKLSYDELLNKSERPEKSSDILEIIRAAKPDIANDKYLDNNTHLLNLNVLTHLNNSFQLRSNIYYLNDRQKEVSATEHTIFLPTDTIYFQELSDNKLHYNTIFGKFSLQKNTKQNYLENNIEIKYNADNYNGILYKNEENISQTLNKPLIFFSNEFKTTNFLGKQLVEFKSYISFDKNDHNLIIKPGVFEQILNDSNSYEASIQYVNLTRFFTDNSAKWIFTFKNFSLIQKLGFIIREQQLTSNLELNKSGDKYDAGTDFKNHIKGRYYKVYFNTGIQYQYNEFFAKVQLPVNWQSVNLSNTISYYKHINNYLFIDPFLSFEYKFKNFWRVKFITDFSHTIDDIDRFYDGFILRNFRNLSKTKAPPNVSAVQMYSLYFSYGNPISSFYYAIWYSFSIRKMNNIFYTLINLDGTSVLQSIEKKNKRYSNNFFAQISKYISTIKTTLRFNVNIGQNKGISLVNNELFSNTVLFAKAKPDVNIRITKWLNTDYTFNITGIKTFVENDNKSIFFFWKHNLDIFIFPLKNHMLSISSNYYIFETNTNFLMDLLYRFTIPKRKIDFEIKWNNIFNEKYYVTYHANASNVIKTNYLIRPSQLFLSVTFSF